MDKTQGRSAILLGVTGLTGRLLLKKLIADDSYSSIKLFSRKASGNTSPSQDDRNITKRLKEACTAIDVMVHDHLIIAGNKHYSFANNGHL